MPARNLVRACCADWPARSPCLPNCSGAVESFSEPFMRQHSRVTDRSANHSLPAALGLPAALLSLISGTVSLAVAFLLWWRLVDHDVQRIGEQAGLFSAAVGFILAAIGLVSPRRHVRGIAIIALGVHMLVVCLTVDSMFRFLGL